MNSENVLVYQPQDYGFGLPSVRTAPMQFTPEGLPIFAAVPAEESQPVCQTQDFGGRCAPPSKKALAQEYSFEQQNGSSAPLFYDSSAYSQNSPVDSYDNFSPPPHSVDSAISPPSDGSAVHSPPAYLADVGLKVKGAPVASPPGHLPKQERVVDRKPTSIPVDLVFTGATTKGPSAKPVKTASTKRSRNRSPEQELIRAEQQRVASKRYRLKKKNLMLTLKTEIEELKKQQPHPRTTARFENKQLVLNFADKIKSFSNKNPALSDAVEKIVNQYLESLDQVRRMEGQCNENIGLASVQPAGSASPTNIVALLRFVDVLSKTMEQEIFLMKTAIRSIIELLTPEQKSLLLFS